MIAGARKSVEATLNKATTTPARKAPPRPATKRARQGVGAPGGPSVYGAQTVDAHGDKAGHRSGLSPAQKSENRLSRWASKRMAALLLRESDSRLAGRISRCGIVGHGDFVALAVREGAEGRSASFGGVVSCGSVWACPVCSAKAGRERAADLNRVLAWARSEGHAVAMLTLTARHGRSDPLPKLLDGMKTAHRTFRQSRLWRALPHVGSVVATEATHGRNGWHVHFHVLVITNGPALDALEGLRPEWLRSLGKAGLSGNGHALQVQDASAAGEYVAKWGAGEEMTIGQGKQAANGGRTPWQLLADARDGDSASGVLWRDFALAFKGRNQLSYSRGLKALALQAATEGEAEGEPEPVTVRRWPARSTAWREARRRRCSLLDAAEFDTDLDAAEYGPTDAQRWRESAAGSDVIEPTEEEARASAQDAAAKRLRRYQAAEKAAVCAIATARLQAERNERRANAPPSERATHEQS